MVGQYAMKNGNLGLISRQSKQIGGIRGLGILKTQVLAMLHIWGFDDVSNYGCENPSASHDEAGTSM